MPRTSQCHRRSFTENFPILASKAAEVIEPELLRDLRYGGVRFTLEQFFSDSCEAELPLVAYRRDPKDAAKMLV